MVARFVSFVFIAASKPKNLPLPNPHPLYNPKSYPNPAPTLNGTLNTAVYMTASVVCG